MKNKIAIFALWCFWWVQYYFDNIDWIVSTVVWYTWWKQINPIYDDLYDHTEAIKIEYNPDKISYTELLEFFLDKRDPTFISTSQQYKSAIYYNNAEEKNEAENFFNNAQKNEIRKIVVEILPQTIFYKAEEYHQKYNEKNLY